MAEPNNRMKIKSNKLATAQWEIMSYYMRGQLDISFGILTIFRNCIMALSVNSYLEDD